MKLSFEVVDPAITLEQLKTFLRVDDDVEDSIIEVIRDAATEYIMRWTGQAIGLIEVTEYFDCWDKAAHPNMFPIVEDSASPAITYLDANNVEQSLSSGYQILANAIPSRIHFASKPQLGSDENKIRIVYLAGKVPTPAMLRVAVMTLAAHWYENREAVTLGTIQGATLVQLEAILHMSGVPYLGDNDNHVRPRYPYPYHYPWTNAQ